MKQIAKFSGNGRESTFIPRNPHKYLGDVDNIKCRSSWEVDVYNFCDNNIRVIGWSSESIVIPYMKPVLNNGVPTVKKANYYPDLYVEYVDRNGELHKELIEIKPKKQTAPSKSKNYATNFVENMTYLVNQAKWEAAKNYCIANGIKFSIMTEDSITKGL